MTIALEPIEDAKILLFFFVLISILDRFIKYSGFFPASKCSGRYFTIHVMVNAYVSYAYFGDVIAVYRDPPVAYLQPTNMTPTLAIWALHIYHLVFYRPLPLVDWAHHGVMILIMLPLAYLLASGAMLGHGSFFTSGFPGGVDYAMLVAVKRGWISSMTEKRINARIQLWIRAPGCLFHCAFTWLNVLEARKLEMAGIPRWDISHQPLIENKFIVYLAVSVVFLAFFWNGLYFESRVTANLAVREQQILDKARAEKMLESKTQ